MSEGPGRFRKKPVVIEAMQYTGGNINEIWDWVGAGSVYGPTELSASAFIDTSEGRMEARPGDWIIKGVKGELYPCKPEIFDATYEFAGKPAARSPGRGSMAETDRPREPNPPSSEGS